MCFGARPSRKLAVIVLYLLRIQNVSNHIVHTYVKYSGIVKCMNKGGSVHTRSNVHAT